MSEQRGGESERRSTRPATIADPSADRRASSGTRRGRYALVASLAFLALVRLLSLPDVFRGGDVVLPSNDPYYYRYWVDLLHGGSIAPWDLPVAVATGEPLFVTTLWLVSLPGGGGQWATGAVLAWYPVVAAVLTGALVYALGSRASGDHRVGLAAVLLLAVVPAHANRTALGFADHHAFDYLWLTATLYLLTVLLTRSTRDRRTWLTASALAVGLAGQVLAWEAGPLLVVPVGLTVAASALAVVGRAPGSPSPLVPVVTGVGGGSGLVLLARVGVGWHTPAVATSVGLLFLGTLAVHALTEAVRRAGFGAGVLAGAGLVAAMGGGATVAVLVPDLTAGIAQGVASLTTSGRIGEVSGLGAAFGPVTGPLVILGFAPFLALVGLAFVARGAWQRRDHSWVPIVVYALYFAGLALVQRRFAGELAPVLAVLAGVGFVRLLAWLDLVRPMAAVREAAGTGAPTDRPRDPPDRTRLAILGGLSTVLLGTGALYSRFITEQVSIDPKAIRAARWMRSYAADGGWTYPENYVLSEWDRNRMFNYFVNGRAASYGYARRHYEDFLFSSTPDGWYDRFEGRVGFIVTRDLEHIDHIPPDRMYARLHYHLGSRADGAAGLGHYRAVHASPDGEYKVFTLVPGATLSGRTDQPQVRVTTTVDLADSRFEYVRVAPTEDDGSFSITVAYPGRYSVEDETVVVSERAVSTGETVDM